MVRFFPVQSLLNKSAKSQVDREGFFLLFNLLVLFLTGCVWDVCFVTRSWAAAAGIYCFWFTIFRTLEDSNRCDKMRCFHTVNWYQTNQIAFNSPSISVQTDPSKQIPPPAFLLPFTYPVAARLVGTSAKLLLTLQSSYYWSVSSGQMRAHCPRCTFKSILLYINEASAWGQRKQHEKQTASPC